MTTSKQIRESAEQTYRWQKKIEKQLCGKTEVIQIKNYINQSIKNYHRS